MRWLPLLAAIVLTAGCSGSKWKPCKDLEITTRNAANQQQWVRYENARYLGASASTQPLLELSPRWSFQWPIPFRC